MNEEILQVFKILEEEKAAIRAEGRFENLTPNKKHAIELLDKIHGRIVQEVALKV